METNRIEFAFLQASKNNASKAAGSSNAFADLLLGAMNQKADALAAGQSAVKATESYTPGRRFDDYPLNSVHFDHPDSGADHVDRRIDNEQSRSRWSVTDTSTNPGRGTLERAEHIEHPGRSAQHSACGDLQVTEAGDTVEGEVPVEPASDTELPDADQDVSLGEEGSAGEEAADDGSDDGQANLDLTPANVPIIEETAPTIETVVDDIAEAAAATTGMAAIDADASAASAPDGELASTPALAAAALPSTSETAPESDGTASMPGIVQGEADDAGATDAEADADKAPVTFAAELALTDTADDAASAAEGRAAAVTAKNERQLEDAGSSFRRNLGNNRRAAPQSPGTAAGANNNANAAAQAASANAEVHASTTVGNGNGSAVPAGTVPVGIDTGLGEAAGLPGWNLHLAQGAATRRGDFVANLRQHLQNLPAHEQVALSIQRSVRDGGGSITLQLSPTELGRIHLKLNIDEENNVQASVVVERPATLDLLQRDMKALERALQDAGLKAGPGDLSFSLQGGDPEAFARDFGSGNGTGSGGNGQASDDGAETDASTVPAAVIATGDGLVDVQI